MTTSEHETEIAKVHVKLMQLRALNKEIRAALFAEKWDIVANLLREHATESAITFNQFEGAWAPSRNVKTLSGRKRP